MVDFDRGIGQYTRKAERSERRTSGADQDFFGFGAADHKARDEDRFTGADFGARGKVDQAIGAHGGRAQPREIHFRITRERERSGGRSRRGIDAAIKGHTASSSRRSEGVRTVGFEGR